MKNLILENKTIIIIFLFLSVTTIAQEKGIKELDFLIGTWETREDNIENDWWETSTREIKYTLKGNFIELKASSIDSNGKKREYSWYINYNKKKEQFQMTSLFSNWHTVLLNILVWDREKRKLTIRNKPSIDGEFRENFGEIIFTENFDSYIWKGENKYGDPNNPSIWKYIEKGRRIK